MNTRLAMALCLALVALHGPAEAAQGINAQRVAAGLSKYGICASCHGIEGRSFKSHYPILAGQKQRYLFRQLDDFKAGLRDDPSMNAMVPTLSQEDMFDLAAYFSSLKPSASRLAVDPAKFSRGRKKAEMARCAMCHGSKPEEDIPRIRGQHHDYLVKQLKDFRDGRRMNDGGVMGRIAAVLSDSDIDDLGSYFSGRH